MKKKLLGFALSVSLASAAALPNAKISGSYVEARNADVYTGECYANSEVNLVGDLAVMGWKIDEGTVDGISLKGLGVVGVIRATSTLGDIANPVNPTKSVLIVDEKATLLQRAALVKFAKRMGGDLFSEVVAVEVRPISLTFADNNMHSVRAKLSAGELASIETRPIVASDQICRHEKTYYPPLTPTSHAMAGYTLANTFTGKGLGTNWSMPEKRSAFVANFEVPML
jgi:hypothetical protein